MPDNLRNRENDLILMPRQSALIKDMTKGFVTVCVGPFKLSLSETDRLQAQDANTGDLRDAVNQGEAIQPYTDVAEGDYVVLSNPTDKEIKWPEPKRNNDMVDLDMGRQVNLPGPLSFPLWPFQTVKLIKGHQLQINQYVLVRVINDEQAVKNWDRAIIKTQSSAASKALARPDKLSVGQLLIIKGTDVSFYIPPTGLEVVADENRQYIREAVTLEQLEYCVLVDQNGTKRYEKGPQVVFPGASETFIESKESDDRTYRKFKAIELTEISGLHIKITAPYTETVGSGEAPALVEHKAGEELFITGREQPIYFPRSEHAIVKYDGRSVHFATAVPKGEGRYVLNRFTGEIRLVRGPAMLLPDPRFEVLVKRVLPERQVRLWYPGNAEALKFNQTLAAMEAQLAESSGATAGVNYLASTSASYNSGSYADTLGMDSFSKRSMASSTLAGDAVGRRTSYTPPRQLTLNTKYEGAVSIDIWTGYAVLVVDRNGQRKVVQGPQTLLLEFDQYLAYLSLSTGKPKTTDKLLETAYLQIANNPVSDIISVETKDAFRAKVRVSYRVTFGGEPSKWFNVENYVKLLTDHSKSLIRNAVKKVGLQDFNDNYISIIRDTVLGVKPLPAPGEPAKGRPLLTFKENGMTVEDVEVLGLEIENGTIASMLVGAQQDVVKNTLSIERSKQELEMTRVQEAVNQERDALVAKTIINKAKLENEKLEAHLKTALATLDAEKQKNVADAAVREAVEAINNLEAQAKLGREKAVADQKLAQMTASIELELRQQLEATNHLVQRAEAIKPDLIAALQSFGDKATVRQMAESLAPMALLGGGSVADVVSKMLKGTGFENVIAGVGTAIAARGMQPIANGRDETSRVS